MKATRIFAITVLLMLAINDVAAASSSQDLSAQPIEPDLASRLNAALARTQTDDMKLSMEVSRRVDYYFYVMEKIDALGKIYRQTLIPMIYQRDLFAGNDAKKTPALIRSPLITGIENLFIQMLQPFYALAILATGVYLLFMSGSPSGRANAKATLVKLVIGLGLITLTLPLMETLLETSHYAASMIIAAPSIEQIGGRVSTDMFMEVSAFFTRYFLAFTYFDTNMGLPFLAVLIGLPASVLMTLSLRYYMVLLFTIFFPFTVLLYSFMATKRIGRILMMQTLLWIFMPIVEAIILVASWVTYESVPYVTDLPKEAAADIKTLTALAGFLMLAAAPLIAAWAVKWLSTQAPATRTYVVSSESEEEEKETMSDAEESEYAEIKEEVQT